MVHVSDIRGCRLYRQDSDGYRTDSIPYRLVGYHILPTNPVGYADNIRTDSVGVLAVAQMGRRMGKVDDKVSDGTFLRGHAILRGFLCAVAL